MIYLILVLADGTRIAFNRRYDYMDPQPSQQYLLSIDLNNAVDTRSNYRLFADENEGELNGNGYWFDPPLNPF